MIKKASLADDNEIDLALDPLVREWFYGKFKEYSISQKYGVLNIIVKNNILISAPTGGTKTLTAFLGILSYLVSLAKQKKLEDKTYCVYISPLKALNNDIGHNLNEPLKEIFELADKKGISLQEIRVNVRTGDTSIAERNKMTRKTPHILITTPESLSIILTTKKFVENLYGIEYVIIDEIHALAPNKRGVHLSLSLERLENIALKSPVRIGLSATIAPLDEIARFLVGLRKENRGKLINFIERDCLIADIQYLKKMDIRVVCPLPDLINTTSIEMQNSLYNLIDSLVQEHKTTIIFTNTRSATERVINNLKDFFPKNYEKLEENIGAHHSSLGKDLRFSIEQRLREGKLKAVVTSTSLELGIDIGYVDLVVLLSSPKSVSRALQRIGRAGHKLHDISKGRIVALDQDDLIECGVLLKESLEKHVDKIRIPTNCLDVLSQHIFGEAIQKIWDVNDLYYLFKQSYCYNHLSIEDFYSVLSYLSGEYSSLKSKNVYAKIWYDEQTKKVGKKGKLARVLYMTNIGTIPDESFSTVVISSPHSRKDEIVGKIDESFLERLKRGDVFVLGGGKYEFLYSRGMKTYVNASVAKPPTIPSWSSETLPLSFDLALAIQKFRKMMEGFFKSGKKEEEIKSFIEKYLFVDFNSINSIYAYFYEQYHFAKIPHESQIIIEKYKEKEGKNYFIVHSLYGRRVNEALSRALAYVVGRGIKKDIEIGLNDNGFFLASNQSLQIEKALKLLGENPEKLKNVLIESIEKTEYFKRRFRHCAVRSLMILKNYKGKTKSAGKQQVSSDFLLANVRKVSEDFPILKETRREILEESMEIENAIKILVGIKEEKIKIISFNVDLPSPFSLNLITQGYVDLMKMENRVEFLKRMHEKIKNKIIEEKSNGNFKRN